MRPRPDPLAVYLDAVRAGETQLAELLAWRLFPWTRRLAPEADGVPSAARATVQRLCRSLGL